ncbi:hypothetical protein GALMADRAFT_256221 [Galerina marginata CBS 339.88]|uniref:Zinc finger PHD-type domain-containing protein n=1 Tax=Galerina marginata (strain CBS 339.88) TaxID=685588 RepID=A0A067SQF8_GALM3|nr:hypothetical protein GALMADRAFT_256221 [Galerina marginata CBS 339.88]
MGPSPKAYLGIQEVSNYYRICDPAKCHPNTRVAILTDLEEWAEGTTHHYPVKWISGSAGVGKTAIMRTTAEILERRKLLLAAFFFWRTGTRCNTAQFFIATLAYQIAIAIPATRPHIEQAIDEDPHIFSRSLQVQSRVLIVDPITAVCREATFPSNYPLTFVIDGLDECLDSEKQCKDTEAQSEVLRTLQWTLQQLPKPFTVLLASRPEYHIQTIFDTSLRHMSSSLILNNLNNVHYDIRNFYIHKFREIQQHHPLRSYLPSPEWPSSEVISRLVKDADGQFIYASTVIKFVTTDRKNPCHQLDCILDAKIRGDTRPFKSLDILYSAIFSTVDKDDILLAMRVIGMLFCVKHSHPNTLPSFWDRFLGLKPGEVERVMLGLESVLAVNGTDGQTFRFYHASLQDFCFDSLRSGPFFIDTDMVYGDLAIQGIHHFDTTEDDIEKFMFEGYFAWEFWLKAANPCTELHNSIEQAQTSIWRNNIKHRFPVFLKGISESQLADKEHLYNIHLKVYHSHLNRIMQVYLQDEFLVALLLVACSSMTSGGVYSFQNTVTLIAENMSTESKDIDKREGFCLCEDKIPDYVGRSGGDLEFLTAVMTIFAKMPLADTADYYATAALAVVKSLCKRPDSLIELAKPSHSVVILIRLLSHASSRSDLVECLKDNYIFNQFGLESLGQSIREYLRRGSTTLPKVASASSATVATKSAKKVKTAIKAVEPSINSTVRRSTRKRGVSGKINLSVCLCGLVVYPTSEGVIECKQTTCDTQWYHITCTGKTQLPQNWVCDVCKASGPLRPRKRLRK